MPARAEMTGSAVPEVLSRSLDTTRICRFLARVRALGVVIYHFGSDFELFRYVSTSLMSSIPVTLFARSLAGSFMFLVEAALSWTISAIPAGETFSDALPKSAWRLPQ